LIDLLFFAFGLVQIFMRWLVIWYSWHSGCRRETEQQRNRATKGHTGRCQRINVITVVLGSCQWLKIDDVKGGTSHSTEYCRQVNRVNLLKRMFKTS